MASWFIFSSYRKITFLGITMSNQPHPSTKPTSMAIQLKTGNERRVSGFGVCNWKPEIRNSEPSLQATISLKTAAYSLKIFSIANRACPHKLRASRAPLASRRLHVLSDVCPLPKTEVRLPEVRRQAGKRTVREEELAPHNIL